VAAKLLVVDDEPGVRDMLADALRMVGYEVEVAADGTAAIKTLHSASFDLVISDVNMPHMNGFELLERMRASGYDQPVILLTARHDRADVATGFRAGADDYVPKPFSLEELMLRVKARLKHVGLGTDQMMICGPVELDESAHLVRVDGKPVELSPTEFKLLYELMRRKEKVVPKATLLDNVWDITWSTSATVLDTYIFYLRKKLHTETWQGIKTVRGVGFSIVSK
jgi:two-component system OmpR family response regulator